VVSNLVRLSAIEIPLVENPRKQSVPSKSRRAVGYLQNGKIDAAAQCYQPTAGAPRQHESSVLEFRNAWLRTVPLFRGLSESEFDEIAGAAQELQFSYRETIFRQDDPVRYVYVIAAGTVKVTQLSECGKEVILRVEQTGSLIDDMTDRSQVHRSSAQAIPCCSVLAWSVAVFEGFAKRFSLIHRNATSIMLGRLRMIEERFCDVTTQRVPQRLARVLIHLAGQTTPGDLNPISLSREELSQMTGTSLFTVSRLLSLWGELDILTLDRKAVIIEDLPRLLSIAESQQSELGRELPVAGRRG
jgi:CRP-like cAMP-binding protein